MYELLDKYITEYGEIDSLWSDNGVNGIIELFQKFSEIDWQKLHHNLPSKSLEWKIKMLSGIVGDEKNILSTIAILMDTKDIELLDMILIIFNNYNYNIIEDKYGLLSNDIKRKFINHLKNIMPYLNKYYVKLIEEFFKKNSYVETQLNEIGDNSKNNNL